MGFYSNWFRGIKKDFRFTPPWGEKVNKAASCKYNESNIKLNPEGIEFWNSVNTESDKEETPYIAGALVTRNQLIYQHSEKLKR
jgi:hypothetical protein